VKTGEIRMNLKSYWYAAPLSLVLAACATGPIEPAVSSFNEASVAIQLNGNQMEFSTEETRQAAIQRANALAAEICARGPNRRAEFASSRNIPTGQYTYVVERLYLCLR
jgi:hypothetical protein